MNNVVTKEKIYEFLFYLSLPLRPNFWINLHKYNPDVDAFIRDILDRNVKGEIHYEYTVAYGDVKVWIGNYPCSYATMHETPIKGRASLYTIYRYKKYVDDIQENKRKSKLGGLSDKEYLSLDRIALNMLVEK